MDSDRDPDADPAIFVSDLHGVMQKIIFFAYYFLKGHLHPVFRIHDILVWIWIRIRGSMPLTNGSGLGSWIRILLFSSLTFKMPAKKLILTQFFCLLLFEGTFTLFFKDKKSKRVTK
jgi:hypothetical protein